jgi:arylformamidase
MPQSPEFFEISRPLSTATACWPGDVPFAFRQSCTIAGGASVNVGAIESSLHNGTHCDAPFHFDNAGATVDHLPLDLFVGPSRVVDVRGLGRWRDRLGGLDLRDTPRVLFRTGGWPESSRFPETIPIMEPDLPDWLADRGVRLIGVDLPSVDSLDSKRLDNHHALARRGIAIVEGLWLEEVPEGQYELLALPIRIVGADASPLRAVLRRLSASELR